MNAIRLKKKHCNFFYEWTSQCDAECAFSPIFENLTINHNCAPLITAANR
jgi:hypothetical protein